MTAQNKVISKIKETFEVVRAGTHTENVVFRHEGNMFVVLEEGDGIVIYRAFEDGPDIKFGHNRKTGKTFRTVTNFIAQYS